MKILVVSDTHGNFDNLYKVVLSHSDADVVIHLGDGANEIDQVKTLFPNKMFVCVKGNCDFGSDKNTTEIITLDGKKIIASHGHLYNVKYSIYNYICAARAENADIALFGHTHVAYTDYDDGLYIMNPGSLGKYNASYGLIEICPAGITTNIIRLKD